MASFGNESTEAGLYAAPKSSLYPPMLDGLPFDEQATWIIPVVRDAKKTSKFEPQRSAANNYSTLVRNLVKSSGIYALASVASPLISLILAPFLTRALSHTDYGALAVLNTAIALMAGATQFGLNSAFFRAYSYDYESQKDRLSVLSTVIALLLLISIPITIATTVAAPWLATALFTSPSLVEPIRLGALVILIQNLTVPGFSWLRAESRAPFFATLAILNLLVTLVGNLVLVGTLHMGIAGSLLATAGGYAVVAICTMPVILLRVGLQGCLRPRFDIARNLLSFGLPLVSSFISVWVLQLSDRYLLSRLGSLAQTASYTIAYSLGGVLGVLVISPFLLAWPTAMYAILKREDAPKVFQLVFRWYSIVLLFATFALSLLGRGVLDILFPPAYRSAAPVISTIALSTMFYGVYNIFLIGISVRRKTWFAVVFTTLAALINVGLNFMLIPFYGSMGAALSTLIAYLVLALIAYIVNQRFYPIPFEMGLFMAALLIGITLYAGSDFLAHAQQTYAAWGIRYAALALYGGCLALLGTLVAGSRKH